MGGIRCTLLTIYVAQCTLIQVTILTRIDSVVFPARDLDASVAFWTAALGREPDFRTDDFASFSTETVSIGLTKLPWQDEPVVFWETDDVQSAHQALSALGSTTLVEIADGSLAPLGHGQPVDGVDPQTGVVDVPGAKLAVLRAPDSTLIALSQPVEGEW